MSEQLDTVIKAIDERDAALKSKLDQFEKQLKEERQRGDALETKLGRPGALALYSSAATPAQAEAKAAYVDAVFRPDARPSGDTLETYREAFDGYIRKGLELISPEQREIIRQVRVMAPPGESKAMSVGVGPDGGYLVTPEMATAITMAEQDFSPVRNLARVITISSDSYSEPFDTDVLSASWVGETDSRSATATTQIRELEIPTREIYAFPMATQRLLDDSRVNIEAYMADKIAQSFAISEGAAFVTGNTPTRPRGFTTFPTEATGDTSRGWGTMEHVATGTNGSFGTGATGANKLIDLIGKLRPGYRAGAAFAMNRSTLSQVRQLKDGNNQFVFVQSIAPGVPSTILGYPVYELEDMASFSTTDALAVAFGNWKRGYYVVDRFGMRLTRDNLTNKPYVGLYATRRVGGDVADFRALKFMKFGNA